VVLIGYLSDNTISFSEPYGVFYRGFVNMQAHLFPVLPVLDKIIITFEAQQFAFSTARKTTRKDSLACAIVIALFLPFRRY
jgi:hypothetical protein